MIQAFTAALFSFIALGVIALGVFVLAKAEESKHGP